MFKGKTRTVFVDKREYGGPLWKQVDDAFQFVLCNIHLGAKLEGIYRKDIYELSPDSIRKIIINAVMNCGYLQNLHIQVAIYDDRSEITSPGSLMPGVTLDKIKEGYSKIRNHALAHAFSYMNLIEVWGSGIPKLMEAMRKYGLCEPEFHDMEIGFRINLYRNTEDVLLDTTQGAEKITRAKQNTIQVTQGTTQVRLTEEDKVVLVVIKKQHTITQKEIAAN